MTAKRSDHEEAASADRKGHDLKGDGAGQEARRRWYFAHQRFEKLQEHHRKTAQEHQAAAAKPTPDELARDVRKRNEAKEREYHAALHEWEEKRLEREDAKEQWDMLRRDIMAEGGIRARDVGEDYSGVPVALRRKGGLALDDMASRFGYGYERDLESHIEATYGRYKKTLAEKPQRPTRPTYEREPRRHGRIRNPRLEAMRGELKEFRQMIKAGEEELGKDHPALDDLRAAYAELQDEYRAARDAA